MSRRLVFVWGMASGAWTAYGVMRLGTVVARRRRQRQEILDRAYSSRWLVGGL